MVFDPGAFGAQGFVDAAPVVARVRLARLVVAGLHHRRLVAATVSWRRPIVAALALDGGKRAMQHGVTLGEALECRLTLTTPEGVPITNAGGVVIKAKPPGQAARTYPTIAGMEPGEWVAVVPFDVPGRWWVAGECSTPTPAVTEVAIDVRQRAVA